MHQYGLQRVVLAVAVIGLFAVPTVAATTAQTPQTQADNSKVNTRDRSKNALTADQQKQNADDVKLTSSIRHSLMQDKELSSYAHNVKIITQAGQVTLKGPVRSEEEKHIVEAKAIELAGEGHVKNEISIAKPKQ